jgi:hypothetical protein
MGVRVRCDAAARQSINRSEQHYEYHDEQPSRGDDTPIAELPVRAFVAARSPNISEHAVLRACCNAAIKSAARSGEPLSSIAAMRITLV